MPTTPASAWVCPSGSTSGHSPRDCWRHTHSCSIWQTAATFFQIFRYEYDALNLKVLVKSQALDKDPADSMSDLGCIPAGKLREQFKNRKLDGLHPLLAQAAMEALEELARTNDPQTVDFCWTRRRCKAMRAKAGEF